MPRKSRQKAKGGKPGKRKGKKGKHKKKMPPKVAQYFKLRNSGMGKAAAKKKAGL